MTDPLHALDSPQPMTATRYSQMRYMLLSGQQISQSMVIELMADREWTRPRVDVSEADVVALGLDAGRQLIAWVEDELDLRHSDSAGIYCRTDDGERLVVQADDEYHRERWRGVTGRRLVTVTAKAINSIARELGREPLDILGEIAGFEK